MAPGGDRKLSREFPRAGSDDTEPATTKPSFAMTRTPSYRNKQAVTIFHSQHPMALLCLISLATFLVLILQSSSIQQTHSAALNPPGKYKSPKDRGCFYMFENFRNGDQIKTNEPCLNCTCENSMLMCYLRVCPYVKPVGDRCIIERVPGECCPRITCPDVGPPGADSVQQELEPDTTTTTQQPTTTTTLSSTTNFDISLANASEVSSAAGGCNLNGVYYHEGAQMPSDAGKPCEVCYCIRNASACVMQDCALEVSGCEPVYQAGGCCPSRYNCSAVNAFTTRRPQPLKIPRLPDPNGRRRFWEYFSQVQQQAKGATLVQAQNSSGALGELAEPLAATSTQKPLVFPDFGRTPVLPPAGCRRPNSSRVYADGERIPSRDKCEHCYCMRSEIVCAVQECRPPCEGCAPIANGADDQECCPRRYECAAPTRRVPAENIVDLPNQQPSNLTLHDEILIVPEDRPTLAAAGSQNGTNQTNANSLERSMDQQANNQAPDNKPGLTDERLANPITTSASLLQEPQGDPKQLESGGETTKPEMSIMTTRQTRPPLKPISPKLALNDDYSSSNSGDQVSSPSVDPSLFKSSTRASIDLASNVDGFNLQEEREQEAKSGPSNALVVPGEGPQVSSQTLPENGGDPSLTSTVAPQRVKEDNLATTTEAAATTTTTTTTQSSSLNGDSVYSNQILKSTGELQPNGLTSDPKRIRPAVMQSSIPGEGSCRYNGKIYQNGQEVKSKDNCMEICMCINSVVYCDEVDCPKGPEKQENCQRIVVEGECCPKYVCPEEAQPTTTTTASTTTSTSESSQTTSQASDATSTTTIKPSSSDSSNELVPGEAKDKDNSDFTTVESVGGNRNQEKPIDSTQAPESPSTTAVADSTTSTTITTTASPSQPEVASATEPADISSSSPSTAPPVEPTTESSILVGKSENVSPEVDPASSTTTEATISTQMPTETTSKASEIENLAKQQESASSVAPNEVESSSTITNLASSTPVEPESSSTMIDPKVPDVPRELESSSPTVAPSTTESPTESSTRAATEATTSDEISSSTSTGPPPVAVDQTQPQTTASTVIPTSTESASQPLSATESVQPPETGAEHNKLPAIDEATTAAAASERGQTTAAPEAPSAGTTASDSTPQPESTSTASSVAAESVATAAPASSSAEDQPTGATAESVGASGREESPAPQTTAGTSAPVTEGSATEPAASTTERPTSGPAAESDTPAASSTLSATADASAQPETTSTSTTTAEAVEVSSTTTIAATSEPPSATERSDSVGPAAGRETEGELAVSGAAPPQPAVGEPEASSKGPAGDIEGGASSTTLAPADLQSAGATLSPADQFVMSVSTNSSNFVPVDLTTIIPPRSNNDDQAQTMTEPTTTTTTTTAPSTTVSYSNSTPAESYESSAIPTDAVTPEIVASATESTTEKPMESANVDEKLSSSPVNANSSSVEPDASSTPASDTTTSTQPPPTTITFMKSESGIDAGNLKKEVNEGVTSSGSSVSTAAPEVVMPTTTTTEAVPFSENSSTISPSSRMPVDLAPVPEEPKPAVDEAISSTVAPPETRESVTGSGANSDSNQLSSVNSSVAPNIDSSIEGVMREVVAPKNEAPTRESSDAQSPADPSLAATTTSASNMIDQAPGIAAENAVSGERKPEEKESGEGENASKSAEIQTTPSAAAESASTAPALDVSTPEGPTSTPEVSSAAPILSESPIATSTIVEPAPESTGAANLSSTISEESKNDEGNYSSSPTTATEKQEDPSSESPTASPPVETSTPNVESTTSSSKETTTTTTTTAELSTQKDEKAVESDQKVSPATMGAPDDKLAPVPETPGSASSEPKMGQNETPTSIVNAPFEREPQLVSTTELPRDSNELQAAGEVAKSSGQASSGPAEASSIAPEVGVENQNSEAKVSEPPSVGGGQEFTVSSAKEIGGGPISESTPTSEVASTTATIASANENELKPKESTPIDSTEPTGSSSSAEPVESSSTTNLVGGEDSSSTTTAPSSTTTTTITVEQQSTTLAPAEVAQTTRATMGGSFTESAATIETAKSFIKNEMKPIDEIPFNSNSSSEGQNPDTKTSTPVPSFESSTVSGPDSTSVQPQPVNETMKSVDSNSGINEILGPSSESPARDDSNSSSGDLVASSVATGGQSLGTSTDSHLIEVPSTTTMAPLVESSTIPEAKNNAPTLAEDSKSEATSSVSPQVESSTAMTSVETVAPSLPEKISLDTSTTTTTSQAPALLSESTPTQGMMGEMPKQPDVSEPKQLDVNDLTVLSTAAPETTTASLAPGLQENGEKIVELQPDSRSTSSSEPSTIASVGDSQTTRNALETTTTTIEISTMNSSASSASVAQDSSGDAATEGTNSMPSTKQPEVAMEAISSTSEATNMFAVETSSKPSASESPTESSTRAATEATTSDEISSSTSTGPPPVAVDQTQPQTTASTVIPTSTESASQPPSATESVQPPETGAEHNKLPAVDEATTPAAASERGQTTAAPEAPSTGTTASDSTTQPESASTASSVAAESAATAAPASSNAEDQPTGATAESVGASGREESPAPQTTAGTSAPVTEGSATEPAASTTERPTSGPAAESDTPAASSTLSATADASAQPETTSTSTTTAEAVEVSSTTTTAATSEPPSATERSDSVGPAAGRETEGELAVSGAAPPQPAVGEPEASSKGPAGDIEGDESSTTLAPADLQSAGATLSPADQFVMSVSTNSSNFVPVDLTTIIPSIRGSAAPITIPWSDITTTTQASGSSGNKDQSQATTAISTIELTTTTSSTTTTTTTTTTTPVPSTTVSYSNLTRAENYDSSPAPINATTESDYEEVTEDSGCEYEGKTYNSAQQIPRSHPCDFCFCFRGDIICLQQTCPPPVPHCFETVIDGFCCPRYECPVHTVRSSPNSTSLSLTPYDTHSRLHSHSHDGNQVRNSQANSRVGGSSVKGCFVDNKLYGVGQSIESASGPCLDCRCDKSGMMKCNPKECTPEDPLLQQINREVLQSTLSRSQVR